MEYKNLEYDCDLKDEVKNTINELHKTKVQEQDEKSKNVEQNVNCSFEFFNWHFKDYVYTCYINFQTISVDAKLNIFGKHTECETIDDVEGIIFNRCTISKVPQGLTKIFPNLKMLLIAHTNLQSVEQSDLIEYKDFSNISFRNNEITYLPGNLFEGMKNLESIWINKNKITIIEPNLLDGLEKLKVVNMKGNPCIDKCYDSGGNEGNATLQEIRDEIKRFKQ